MSPPAITPVPLHLRLSLAGSLLAVVLLLAPFCPPGVDTDSPGIAMTVTRLLHEHRYHVSRTPGQPLLDFATAILWKALGKPGVLAAYAAVCYAGLISLYRLASNAGVRQPGLVCAAVLLTPGFLLHVPGLGDWAVSLSLFLLTLSLLEARRDALAAVAFAACAASRLNYSAMLLPMGAFLWLTQAQPSDAAARGRALRILRFSGLAGLLTALAYTPGFLMFGPSLLRNVQFWHGWSYHLVGSVYKLLVHALGLPLASLAAVALVQHVLKRYRRPASIAGASAARPLMTPLRFQALAAGVAIINLAVFVRIPTKAEILLPVVVLTIVLVSLHWQRWGSTMALACVVSLGVIQVDLHDPATGGAALRLVDGLYLQGRRQADANRNALPRALEVLRTLPPNSAIIVWRLHTPVPGMPHLLEFSYQPTPAGQAAILYHTPALALENKHLLNFEDPRLPALLKENAALPQAQRLIVHYDPMAMTLARRWSKLDLSQWGEPVEITPAGWSVLPAQGVTLWRVPQLPHWLQAQPKR